MIPFVQKELEGNVNIAKDSLLGELLKLSLGIALILVMVYFALGLLVDIVVPFIPPEMERTLGESYHIPGGAKNNKEAQKLQSIVDRLQAHLPRYHCKVHYVQSGTVNAVALPGHHIIVFSGLKKLTQSDDEMAFVLAHELGHFTHRDHLRAMGRGLLMNLAILAATGNQDALGRLTVFSEDVIARQFSQQQETQADNEAFYLLKKAGYDVNGATQFFEHLRKTKAAEGSFLSTHPPLPERLARMKRLSDISSAE